MAFSLKSSPGRSQSLLLLGEDFKENYQLRIPPTISHQLLDCPLFPIWAAVLRLPALITSTCFRFWAPGHSSPLPQSLAQHMRPLNSTLTQVEVAPSGVRERKRTLRNFFKEFKNNSRMLENIFKLYDEFFQKKRQISGKVSLMGKVLNLSIQSMWLFLSQRLQWLF